MSAGATKMGELHREVFHDVDLNPLCMIQGNIRDNLEKLRSRETRDPTVRNMKKSLDAGMPVQHLEAALEFRRDTPCTVAMVEEAHACAAWVMREHPSLTASTLVARSMLSQLRPWFTKSAHTIALDAIDRQLLRLGQVQPQDITGRHLVFRDLAKRSASAFFLQMADAMERNQECIKVLNEVYDGMPLSDKIHLAIRREAVVGERKDELQRFKRGLLEQKRSVEAAFALDVEVNGVRNHVGAIRLDDNDLEAVCTIMSNSSWRPGLAR